MASPGVRFGFAMARARTHRSPPAGFTLVELVVILLIISIVAVYAAVTTPSNAEATLSQQAHLLARHLRHAQTLAMTWGRPLRLTAGGGAYAVSCVTAGAAPCDASPVTDPATRAPFSVGLAYGVTVSGATVDFDVHGRPSAGATFTLSGAGATDRTVALSVLTGFVAVTP